MSTISHPFASSRYARFSRSADTLTRWLRNDKITEVGPTSALPPPGQGVAPARPPPVEPAPISPPLPVDITIPLKNAESSPGHYVRHSSKLTLLLSGQESATDIPVYTNGSTIDGILAVTRPSGLLALEVQIEGRMGLSEVAGSGNVSREIIKESLFIWNAERNATFPSKVTFRYTLPGHYTHRETGERFRIPPTYDARLVGMPGFRVQIFYAIVVRLSRNRDMSDWWRKSTSVRIPFKYVERSRPSLACPFPPNPVKAPNMPKTLFNFILKSKCSGDYDLGVGLFLPTSQVCSLSEPIPFYITLTGDEDSLAPFAALKPSANSFHPLRSPEQYSPASISQQILSRSFVSNFPAAVHLLRTTKVDVLKSTQSGVSADTSISASTHLAKGIIHNSTSSESSLIWYGEISVPADVSTGAFQAKGVCVSDRVSLVISTPSGSPVHYVDFCETIPIRLTTEPYDSYAATFTVSSDWSLP